MISYLVTVCNEHEELEKVLTQLVDNISLEDEIVVLVDSSNTTEEVSDVIKWFLNCEPCKDKIKISSYEFPFNGNFSEFKNYGNTLCKLPWIFQIDADEYFSPLLLESLAPILRANEGCELVYIPRINTVHGMTEEDIKQYGWTVNRDDTEVEEREFDKDDEHLKLIRKLQLIINERNYMDKVVAQYYSPIVNFPDYQGRLYRNRPYIFWEGKVHETIKGAKAISKMPHNLTLNLYHPKNIQRQRRQNSLYNALE